VVQRTKPRVAAFAAPLVAAALAGCAPAPPPPPVAKPEPPAPVIALERVCQDALPLSERSVGALTRLLRRINPDAPLEVRPCGKGTQWPIAYATGESLPKAPVGFVVLRMEGDALLTFDAQDRESPTMDLCADLEFTLDDRHRVRAIALWPSTDERGFDPEHPESSKALLAWLELLSRTPSACALGRKEAPGETGEDKLTDEARCADQPLVLANPCEARAKSESDPKQPQPTADEVDRAALGTHRFTGAGRTRPPKHLPYILERAERCLYEPPPAERDVCVAVYTDPDGNRWYGRGDVTRTGVGGEKNYVDSYLTFQVLKRIEAERKGLKPVVAPAPGPTSAPKK
jgi:hypothetical protein